jgi:hypothetical protein
VDWTRDVQFTWGGSDEKEAASDDRDAGFEDDGTLTGEIRFHLGDDSSFRARAACGGAEVRF